SSRSDGRGRHEGDAGSARQGRAARTGGQDRRGHRGLSRDPRSTAGPDERPSPARHPLRAQARQRVGDSRIPGGAQGRSREHESARRTRSPGAAVIMFIRSKGAAVVAAAAIAAGAIVWAWSARSPSPHPRTGQDQDVLLVTIDTLRTDALSSYGGPGARGGPARTPNLDGLAKLGTRFDFAHAHAVLTRPSHASILTGTYPYEHGVRDHSGYRLQPGTTTLATLLKADGFATGAFVGGVPLERRFGLDGGFDVYDDRFGRTGNASDFTLAERPAGEVVDVAVKWIAAQKGRWFAGAHVFDPRARSTPPPP